MVEIQGQAKEMIRRDDDFYMTQLILMLVVFFNPIKITNKYIVKRYLVQVRRLDSRQIENVCDIFT